LAPIQQSHVIKANAMRRNYSGLFRATRGIDQEGHFNFLSPAATPQGERNRPAIAGTLATVNISDIRNEE
jgi:hypothetical protein